MAKKSESYYKELKDLTIDELYCYGTLVGVSKPTTVQRKDDILKSIVQKENTFLDEAERKFYFVKTASELKYLAAPNSPDSFPQKQIPATNQVKVELLRQEIENEKEKLSESSINLDTVQIENDTIFLTDQPELVHTGTVNGNSELLIQQLLEKLTEQQVPKERKFAFRQKLKYEPSHGIEAFIRSVEAYAAANEISDKTKWVAVAKSALNQSEDGILIQDSLQPEEESNWNLFKAKLLSILGRAPDYYRDFYRSFRRGSQKPGLAMSRLTQAYKRGFGCENMLSEHDKKHIMLQFIESLDNPLRGLVKAEENRLTFSNIAERAAELERCFGRTFQPDSAASLMFPEGRVQFSNAVMESQKQDNSVQIKMIELLTTLTDQSKAQHNEMLKMVKKPPARFGGGNRVDLSAITKKLDGHCYFHVKFGSCTRRECRFKHESNIPQEIKNVVL